MERHSSIPDGHDRAGMMEVIRQVVEQHVAQAATEQDTTDQIEYELRDAVSIQRRAAFLRQVTDFLAILHPFSIPFAFPTFASHFRTLPIDLSLISFCGAKSSG